MAHVFPASGRRHYGTDSTPDSALNDANAASASLWVVRSGWFCGIRCSLPDSSCRRLNDHGGMILRIFPGLNPVNRILTSAFASYRPCSWLPAITGWHS